MLPSHLFSGSLLAFMLLQAIEPDATYDDNTGSQRCSIKYCNARPSHCAFSMSYVAIGLVIIRSHCANHLTWRNIRTKYLFLAIAFMTQELMSLLSALALEVLPVQSNAKERVTG
ncbi:hypothetical protein BDR04DRAFT_568987 [Suillus decipiens]|nr:hypothetical protein BDR04DRAFT_568987 [Suillus decipiens]